MMTQEQIPARLQTPPGPAWYRRKMAQSRSAVIRRYSLPSMDEILKQADASRPFTEHRPDGDL